jgi:hypothetical protein
VGPTCQPPLSASGPPISGRVTTHRAPIGCCGWRCPNAPGGLKAVPTVPSHADARTRRPASPVPTGRLSRQRRCPSWRHFASPSRSPPCPKPSTPPSTPSVRRWVRPRRRISRASVYDNLLPRPRRSPPVAAVPPMPTSTLVVPPDAAVYAIVLRHRPHTGEPHHAFPGRLPCAGEVAAARQACRTLGHALAVHVGRANAVSMSHVPLCYWAEREFGPVTLDLVFLISEYI